MAHSDLWIVLLGTVLLELYALRRLRFDRVVVALVLLGTVLQVDYLGYTSISERNYDGPSHIEYIQSIAQHHRLPDVFACGACGHPPLYYALAAAWSKVVVIGGWIPYELGLQWLSLLLFFGFVVFALSIFRSCTSQPATLRLATALVVFWPSSIINAVRVHNDALASLLMLGAMYFIARWDRDGIRRDFHLALLFCALALLTKSSGYALATTLVLLRPCVPFPPRCAGRASSGARSPSSFWAAWPWGRWRSGSPSTRAPSVKRCWGTLATVGTCPPSSIDRVVSSASIYGGS